MLCDFIFLDNNVKTPLYRQIYISVRRSVENGSLKKGTKMPSIRKLSSDLGVSKTTVTSAYEQLCVEGYIINKPQSGYYVEAQFDSVPIVTDNPFETAEENKPYFEYDFSGKSIDDRIINMNEWKRYVKDTLNRNNLLTSYGDEQGEPTLRSALQKYSLGTRSVNTNGESIIVGAGTQPLLYILCSLIGLGKRVAVADTAYVQSELVFSSFGYEIITAECDRNGVTVESLKKIKPDIIMINPNFTRLSGENMPITRRLEIIEYARNNNALIIEDDYNGELRYSTHPIPCVQNYDSENTVYIGSFSKVLLPSVRISYMAIPKKLTAEYKLIKHKTNQTASKTEQLALASYIDNGRIDKHLRKARRIYLEKSKVIVESIHKYFGDDIKLLFNETSLYVTICLKYDVDSCKMLKILKQNSLDIMNSDLENRELRLSFSGIEKEKINQGINLLYYAVKECKK